MSLALVSDPGPESLELFVRNPLALTMQLGAFLEARSLQMFRTGQRGDVEWLERTVPNLPGVIEDLKKAPTPKAERFSDSPVLIDKGWLAQSIRARVSSPFEVIVGTVVPYARYHHLGLTRTIPIPRDLIPKIKKLPQKYPAYHEAWARLLKASEDGELEWSVPARPLVFVTDEDRAQMSELVSDAVRGSA